MGKLTKRADGRYQRRVTLSDGTKKVVYGKSEPEVNRKVRELEKVNELGINIYDKTTFGEWAVEWFKTYKSNLRQNTLQSIMRNYNNHIMSHLANMLLKDIKQTHCQNVMNNISKYSEDLQRKVLNIMKQIFNTAISNNLIAKNPSEFLKITPHAEKQNKIKFLTEAQQKQLLDNITEPRAKAFVALCLYAGLRREEALGLLWVDIKENKIHVNRSLTFPVNQPDDNRELKTKAANRIIPMPDDLKKILKDTPKTSFNIVPNIHGREMTLSAFKRMWSYAEKSVDFHIYPYMLRHSYASSLYRLGIDIKTAQYLMGHTDIRTTLNIYTHIETTTMIKATEKIKVFKIG